VLGTETEIKVKIGNLKSFCDRLDGFNPRVISARHFEDNHLLDFQEKTLQASGCLARIRYADGKTVFTYKGPAKANAVFKTREELETGLLDGISGMKILEKLGMRVWFRYQKYRREFEIRNVLVTIDETPIGNYAELEGTEHGIRDLARDMGIEESRFIRQSYYTLYLEWCRLRDDSPGNMVFSDENGSHD
jgi:adenylate cyclase class 2